MYLDKKVFAIIVAAGKGTRIGFDKMLYKIDGVPVVERSVQAFQNNQLIDGIVVVAGDNIEQIKLIAAQYTKVINVVRGGSQRAESVANGLAVINSDGLVAVHDGARPYVSDEIITETVTAAAQTKAAIPCVPVKDTIKMAQDSVVEKSLPREKLYITQTPQVFDIESYRKLLAENTDFSVTDDAQLFENAGYQVAICKGSYENFKITTIEDIKKEKSMRIGHGYDVHKLVENRKLILGGVEIPYEKGLLGHSDADVLAHAISDALLGALALGDIGKHFPDTDPQYKGADSLYLMSCVKKLLDEKGAKIENVDATILCQRPKLAPHIAAMRENIARTLGLSADCVSVKATTEEGLGFTGSGEGIAVHAVCLLSV
ncbi:MAG: 2-C-methyl-D-erythritol 2,4-cyclodiphosphate synthase [Ruminococcaceae bacterium]|nr:2-C-methyl-D-erythritol 2,4-cyclodiphosphate synthase [Oscillospiraceae bacterium]